MSKPILIVTDAVSPEIDQAIGGGLNNFNDAATGISDRRPLAVV